MCVCVFACACVCACVCASCVRVCVCVSLCLSICLWLSVRVFMCACIIGNIPSQLCSLKERHWHGINKEKEENKSHRPHRPTEGSSSSRNRRKPPRMEAILVEILCG